MSHLSGKSLILCDVNALSIIFISVGAFLIFRGFEKMCDVNTLLNKKSLLITSDLILSHRE